jgi:hypothetical protein
MPVGYILPKLPNHCVVVETIKTLLPGIFSFFLHPFIVFSEAKKHHDEFQAPMPVTPTLSKRSSWYISLLKK